MASEERKKETIASLSQAFEKFAKQMNMQIQDIKKDTELIPDIRSELDKVQQKVEENQSIMEKAIAKVELMQEKVDKVEQRMDQVEGECGKKDRMQTIKNTNWQNDAEQRQRSYSVRVCNLTLPVTVIENAAVAKYVFEVVFIHMLKRTEDTVSGWRNYIENAHTLPSKNSVRPIIVRFYSRISVNSILTHKREVMKELEKTIGKVYINPDVTNANANKMYNLRKDTKIQQVWFAGKIKIKVYNSDKIFIFKSLEQGIDDLVPKHILERAETAKRDNNQDRTETDNGDKILEREREQPAE